MSEENKKQQSADAEKSSFNFKQLEYDAESFNGRRGAMFKITNPLLYFISDDKVIKAVKDVK